MKKKEEQEKDKLGLSHNRTKLTILLPGFTNEQFDARGNLQLYSMMKLFQQVTDGALLHPQGIYRELAPDYEDYVYNPKYLLFTITHELEISLKLYELINTLTMCKNSYNCPIRASSQLCHIGTSSYVEYFEVIQDGTDDILLSCHNHTVMIDPQTRRPKAIPNGSELAKRITNTKSSKRVQPMAPPTGAFCNIVKVQYTDTDTNSHANQASYVTFCINTLFGAVKQGYFTKDKLYNGNIRKVTMLYTGESLIDDQLLVKTWQDRAEDSKVYFALEKKGNIIVHCSFDYYPKTKQPSQL